MLELETLELDWEPLKILSSGNGTPSTSLSLMSCENAHCINTGRPPRWPKVPVYDYILFCDLHAEPSWVRRQADFVAAACNEAGIIYKELDADLYGDFTNNFGKSHVSAIPAWTVLPDGGKGKLPRQCTCDYKIKIIDRFIRYEVLNYVYHHPAPWWDKHFHEMHLGIMYEERRRAKESEQTIFENKFPLVEMGWTRADCFRYNKETWGLETWASSCVFCPFHTGYFFSWLKEHEPESYAIALEVDEVMERNKAIPPLKSVLYLTKRRKRLRDLTDEDAGDFQTFSYEEQPIWNGF